jgi:serine/threonine-protein kinase
VGPLAGLDSVGGRAGAAELVVNEPAFDREVDPHALRPGTRLGKYTILRRFAVGGMAELYLAKATGAAGFEKVFALKRVRPVLASDRDFVEMFLREARIAACLDHPNIARVIDVGHAGMDYFFVMEFVHGESLRNVLKAGADRAGIPIECGVAIIHAAARGLHHAHEATKPTGEPLLIVHRDVSPSNVLVSFHGDVKVVDFGIAKALAETRQTSAGVLKGKVGYMSPEQCIGDPVDRRSDVFGLGILLYEVTTCRRLFTGESQFAVMNQVMRGRFERPRDVVDDYPADLEDVVLAALRVEPEARQPTAEALQLDLERVAKQHGFGLSPRVLEDMMRGMFGERPAPSTRVPESVDEHSRDHSSAPSITGWETPSTVEPNARRGRRLARAIALPLGLTAVGAVAWVVATDREDEPVASRSVEPTAPAERSQPTPTRAAPAKPVAPTAADPPEAQPQAQPQAQAEAQPSAEPDTTEQSASAKEPSPRKRRRSNRTAKERDPAPKPAKPLFPEGL